MLSPLANQTTIKHPIAIFMVMALTIFAAALFSISTRPLSFMAIFWLPNAIFLGLLLRFPHFQKWYGWLGGIIGYLAADLITGSNVSLTLALTTANLAHVVTAVFLIKLTKLDYNRFNHGLTFFYLFILISISGLISAITAILLVPHMPNTFMSNDHLERELIMWWTAEIQNTIMLLPVILTWPNVSKFQTTLSNQWHKIIDNPKIMLPLLVIIISACMGYYFSGPGALMFPIAGMLWAALTYNFFTITLINLIVCSALFYSITQFYLGFSQHDYLETTVSARIGVFMMALAPLTVALISQNRTTLFQQLQHHVNYDALTQAMSRRNFLDSTLKRLRLMRANKTPFAILMIDLDYFKSINDNYGHHVGDLTLQHFVKITQQMLRQNDLFGRLGGEEFAIFLSDIQPNEALNVAKRIQTQLEQSPLIVSADTTLHIRVSIGLFHHNESNENLEELLSYADEALYKAKSLGRNQVQEYIV